jgi:pyruvate/2-oxoglutarate dehydrogenase complex dihydrolipoamide dehydrogenase (E3) component
MRARSKPRESRTFVSTFGDGTCVDTGCTPTKTLVASAHAAHMARRGADYGFATGGKITVDMKRVKARKDHVVGLSNHGLERSLKGLENCRVYQGHAHFVAPREVEVGAAVLGADRTFINVGGRAAPPEIPGLDGIDYLTNSSMMDVDFLPRHLLVLGGGYVGLGRRALVGGIAMEDVSRAFEKGETEGFMKVLVDADSKEILGASFLGTSGDEAIHCVLDTMYAKAPYAVLQRVVHIHPTVAEFIPTLLGDLSPLG